MLKARRCFYSLFQIFFTVISVACTAACKDYRIVCGDRAVSVKIFHSAAVERFVVAVACTVPCCDYRIIG